jgi:hypothetical protein
MVGNHQKIKRSVKLDPEPCRRGEFFTTRKAVGVFRDQPGAEGTCVHRHTGVQVGVAPKDLGWKVTPRIGRVMFLRGKGALSVLCRSRQSHGIACESRANQAKHYYCAQGLD